MDSTRPINGSTALLDHKGPEIISVTPASGVWAVYLCSGTGDTRYGREPVVLWALVRSPDGANDVVPMIADEGLGLSFVDESFRWLWNEATAERCRCGYVSPPAYSAADPWWCRACAALIEPPA